MAGAESAEDVDKFKLTEKELEELDQMKLTTGLSDSIIEEETGPAKTNYKIRNKKGKPPPTPTHRDSMGRYIVPKGGQPLTKNDFNYPDPQSYDPNYDLTQKNAPKYTLGENHYRKASKGGTPGPNKWNLQGDLNWQKCKRLTIKVGRPVDRKAQGTDAYYALPTTLNQGPKGPKITLKAKDKSVRVQGFVSALASQPDPSVPGPQYDVMSDWNKPVTFGMARKDPKKKKHPGPNKYKIRKDEPPGPKWKMGVKLAPPELTNKFVPAPDSYNIRGKIGEHPKAVITSRHPPKPNNTWIPGPDIYHRGGFDLHEGERGYTMQYRWFEPDIIPKAPTATTYRPKDVTKKNSPGYSFQNRTTPTYPSSVYAHLTVQAPAPDTYSLPESTPQGISMGRARNIVVENTPGPADYTKSDLVLRNAPAFSLAQRYETREDLHPMPGPANYSPKIPPSKGVKIAKKIKSSNASAGPGPGAYNPCVERCTECEGDAGVSLKSRHTPHKYSGLKVNTFGRLDPAMGPLPLIV